jgi:hypothetical protein
LKVAKAEKSAALVKGVMRTELDSFQQGIDKAEENIAEAKLFEAIARNSPAKEIEAKNQSLILIRAAHQNSLLISGNNSTSLFCHVSEYSLL